MSPAAHPDFDDEEVPPWERDGSGRVDTSAPIRPPRRGTAKPTTTFCQTPVAVITDRRLRDKEVRLYDWLDWKAGASGVAKASYPEMAEAMGCSVKTIQRSLPSLLEVGRIEIEREPAGHGRGWYRVVNEHRRPDTLVPSTGEPDGTDLSDTETNRSDEEGLEGTSVSPLLESFEESGWESEQPTAPELVDDASGYDPEGREVADLPMVDGDWLQDEVPEVDLASASSPSDPEPGRRDDLSTAAEDQRWFDRAGDWDRPLAGPCSSCGARTGIQVGEGWLCSACSPSMVDAG